MKPMILVMGGLFTSVLTYEGVSEISRFSSQERKPEQYRSMMIHAGYAPSEEYIKELLQSSCEDLNFEVNTPDEIKTFEYFLEKGIIITRRQGNDKNIFTDHNADGLVDTYQKVHEVQNYEIETDYLAPQSVPMLFYLSGQRAEGNPAWEESHNVQVQYRDLLQEFHNQ